MNERATVLGRLKPLTRRISVTLLTSMSHHPVPLLMNRRPYPLGDACRKAHNARLLLSISWKLEFAKTRLRPASVYPIRSWILWIDSNRVSRPIQAAEDRGLCEAFLDVCQFASAFWGLDKSYAPGRAGFRCRSSISFLFLIPRIKNFALQTRKKWWSILGSN